MQDIIPVIDFYPNQVEDEFGQKLHVLNTTKRTICTLQYGTFIVRKIQLYNPHNKWEDDRQKIIKKYNSMELKTLVKGKKRFSSDIMCLVGRLRFMENKSREEVQVFIEQNYSLSMSTGTISNYSLEFLIRFKLYHDLHFENLVEAMRKEGGYVLGADGTGDGESNRVLLLMDLIKGWTLSAATIPTEKSDFIMPLFKNLVDKTGKPLAFVRDMGKGLRKAGEELFSDIPTRECNFHFLRDVGKDLMTTEYQKFRKTIIATKIKPELIKLRKYLHHQAKLANVDLKNTLQSLKQYSRLKEIEPGDILLVETYHLISWILNYSEDGQGLRFPYSLPWLYLNQRCRSAKQILTEILTTAKNFSLHPPYLKTLEKLLASVLKGDLATKLDNLELILLEDYNYFVRLRKILRFSEKNSDIPRDQLLLPDKELEEVEKELKKFKEELTQKVKQQPFSKQNSEQIILTHLEQHWNYIIVPNLNLTVNGKEKTLVIPRAISLADSRFGKIKTSIRRRTGKKDTGYELNRYGVLLCYLENLHSPEYIQVMFNSIDAMPKTLETIPKQEVEKAIVDFNTAQCSYDITKASGEDEFENFLNLVSTVRAKAVVT